MYSTRVLTRLKRGESGRDGFYGAWASQRILQRGRKIRVNDRSVFVIHGLLTQRFCDSPHLLAPTASDLVKYGQKDTILAGFHTDLNFLTIHGRSRYPGLNIWARNTGKRIPVKFPATGSYLLVQAGKQIEHLTGGLIKAGYHEVVVNEATLEVRLVYTFDVPFR